MDVLVVVLLLAHATPVEHGEDDADDGEKDQEDDGEPFEEKMKRLTSELSGMFEKSHELEEEIRKKLGAIGYDIK